MPATSSRADAQGRQLAENVVSTFVEIVVLLSSADDVRLFSVVEQGIYVEAIL